MRSQGIRFVVLAVLWGSIGACRSPQKAGLLSAAEQTRISRTWKRKVEEKLRAGYKFEDWDSLAGKTKADIVDLVLKDRYFLASVFLFNMYFIDEPDSQLTRAVREEVPPSFRQDPDELVEAVQSHPTAFLSAHAVFKNGDYFSLFRSSGNHVSFTFLFPEDTSEIVSWMNRPLVDQLVSLATKLKTENPSQIELTQLVFDLYNRKDRVLLGGSIVKRRQYNSEGLRMSTTSRSSFTVQPPLFKDLRRALASFIDFNKGLLNQNFSKDKLKKTLQDAVDRGRKPKIESPHLLQFPRKFELLKEPKGHFIVRRTTTVGNRNYSRAADVFRRFLCDDLQPSQVNKLDANLDEKAHASAPACRSCHYKLDPMSGLFRWADSEGRVVTLTSTSPTPQLDYLENSGISESEYMKFWRSEGEEKTWNTGVILDAYESKRNVYIRDERRPELKLLEYLRTSKEVRTCLVEKMAAYFVTPNMTFDPFWIKELAAQFDVPHEKTGEAFRKVVKKISLSKSFTVRNPRVGECYDEGTGDRDDKEQQTFIDRSKQLGLSCGMRALLYKRCVECHNPRQKRSKYDFINFKRIGRAVGKERLYPDLLDSLTTSDPDLKMPQYRIMPQKERAYMIQWLQAAKGE